MRILNTSSKYKYPQPSDEDTQALCCHKIDPPPCAEKGRVSQFKGKGQPDVPGVEESVWPVIYRAVNTPQNGVCGKLTEKWEKRQKNCCDGVLPLDWDPLYDSETISPGGYTLVGVTGGKGPFIWSVTGQGYYLLAQGKQEKSIITAGGLVAVHAAEGTCGVCKVTVEDACEQSLEKVLRNTNGYWTKVEDCNDYNCPSVNYWGSGPQITITDGEYKHVLTVPGDCQCGSFGALSCWPTLFKDGDYGLTCGWWGNSWSYDCCHDALCRMCVQVRSTFRWVC